MAISAARMDRLISETRKNDPRISIDDNFRNFLSFLAEPFYDVDSRSCRVKKGVRSYGFRTTLIRNGMVRMLAFETDAMTLRYSIKKNPYHSFVKFLMVTEGSLSVTVNGVRTLKPEVNQVLIVDPTDDITYATARGTKGVSILLASNYFHARSSHLAALFKELLISGKTPRESCFIGALEAVRRHIPSMAPDEAEDYCDGLCAFLRPVLSECFKDKEKAFSTHQDFLRACAVDAMFKHIGDASVKADTIAREVGVSTRYLSDLFKKTGKTVMNRFLELRLERASTELRDEAFNEFSIEEIAKKNGFVSPAHFARVFKKFYGKTPREWRTAILVNRHRRKNQKARCHCSAPFLGGLCLKAVQRERNENLQTWDLPESDPVPRAAWITRLKRVPREEPGERSDKRFWESLCPVSDQILAEDRLTSERDGCGRRSGGSRDPSPCPSGARSSFRTRSCTYRSSRDGRSFPY